MLTSNGLPVELPYARAMAEEESVIAGYLV
jgi:hypothetical protein